MRVLTADFETTTDPADCRVWAWGMADVEHPEDVETGVFIEGFFDRLEELGNARVYFHNLAFDGSFMMDHMERTGWRWVADRSDLEPYCYTTVISDMNQVYALTLRFPRGTVKVYDSLKVIPLPIKAIPKAFGLPIMKGEIEYDEYRAPGHELTADERRYLCHDVSIAAMAVKQVMDAGDDRMTAGSNALSDYKRMMGGHRRFRKWFPVLVDEDPFIRRAYKGGWCYADPRHAGRILGPGIVFDVNSLYPSVMAATDGQLIPYGDAQWFDGKPASTRERPLWVAQVTCSFHLKDGKLPCIQLKNNPRFRQTEYLTDSKGEVTLTVTSVDWELYNSQYDLQVSVWHGGFRFKGSKYLFADYVSKWTEVKIQATLDGNWGLRTLAKVKLNSLYGKMATRLEVMSRRPVMVNGVVRYVDLPPETREPVYLPAGVFITAHARAKTVTAAQSVYPRFCYADTDSIHLIGTDVPVNLDVDDVRLGAWKHESTFTRAKFIRPKCYAEEIDGGLTVHVCGMPDNVHSQVTLDNLDYGAVYAGKLYQKRVEGGVVLVPGDMEIRRS